MIYFETVSRHTVHVLVRAHLLKSLQLGILILMVLGCTRQPHVPPSTQAKPDLAPRAANSYYYFTEAQLHRKQGDIDAAIDYLKKAISSVPDSIYLKRELAILHLHVKDSQSALAVVQSILDTSPDNIDALIMYGRIHHELGQNKPARDAYGKVLELDPKQKRIYTLLGDLLESDRNFDGAKTVYEKLVLNFPSFAMGHFLLGGIYAKLDMVVEAEKAFNEASRLKPDWDDPLFELVELLKSKSVRSSGTHESQKVVVEPGDTLSSLAMRYYNDFNETIANKILKANPGLEDMDQISPGEQLNFPPLEDDNKSHQQGSDYTADIIDRYNRILNRHPGNIRAQMELGLFYHHQGMAEDAKALWGSLGRRSEQEFEIIVNVIRRYLNPGRYSDAIIVVNGLRQSAPDNDNLHYLLGASYYGKKEFQPAIHHFERVSARSRFFPEAVAHISFMYQESDELKRGIAYLTEVIQTVPDNAEFYYYLAALHEEDKAYAQAVEALERGIEIDPKNAKLLFRLGVVYDKWNRKNDSMEMMKRVIAIDPKHANALNYLGYTYADQGQNLDEAERLIKKALKYKPGDGYITDSLGWVYFKKGLYEKALEFLEKAVELVPNDTIILEHLGDAYLKTNNKKKAIQVYQRSLEQRKKDREGLDEKIQKLRQEGY